MPRRTSPKIALTAALTLVLVGIAPSAWAVAFTVNTTADSHDRTLGDSKCVDSSGKCSLRAAIEEANRLKASLVITVPAGTYMLNPASGFGQLSVTAPVTINGAGPTQTIIDGAGKTRVMSVDVISLLLTGVTLRNGNGCDDAGRCGASRPGGNLYVRAGGMVTARHTIFTRTIAILALPFPGGGIAVSGTLDLDSSTVDGNSTPVDISAGTQYAGGGIFVFETGRASIYHSTISRNRAVRGGGIAAGGGFLKVVNSTISGNFSNVEGGAGIHIGGNGGSDVMYSTITNNTILNGGSSGTVPLYIGGGIRVYQGTLNLGKCIVAGNIDGRSTASPNYSPDIGQDDASTITSFDDNLIGIVGKRLGHYVGFDGVAYDWLGNGFVSLGPLANNGGETMTHQLLDGDPIESYSGNGGAVRFGPPADDQTLFPRPSDGDGDGIPLADSGSYEY